MIMHQSMLIIPVTLVRDASAVENLSFAHLNNQSRHVLSEEGTVIIVQAANKLIMNSHKPAFSNENVLKIWQAFFEEPQICELELLKERTSTNAQFLDVKVSPDKSTLPFSYTYAH